jgi:hypothetical protein
LTPSSGWHAALLAVVSERSREGVDVAMSNLGGTVVRRSVDDAEAEVAAAEKAQRKAKAEARKQLAHSRHEYDEAAVNAKVADPGAKLHHEEKIAWRAATEPPLPDDATPPRRRRRLSRMPSDRHESSRTSGGNLAPGLSRWDQ